MSQSDDDGVLSPQREAERVLTVREEVLDVLLEKVGNDHYPSAAMLDDIERLLTPWRRQDYAEVLMDKIRQDRYPSRHLIERAIRLSG